MLQIQIKSQARMQPGFGIDGGDEEDRTPDLRIANATLSQLSYVPTMEASLSAAMHPQNTFIAASSHIHALAGPLQPGP